MQNKTQTNKKTGVFTIFLAFIPILIGFLDSDGINYYLIFSGVFFLILGYFMFIFDEDKQEKEKYEQIMRENIISSKLQLNEKVINFFIGDYRYPYAYASPLYIIFITLSWINVWFVFMTNKGIHFQEISRGKESKFTKYMFYSYNDILFSKISCDFPFGKMLTIIFLKKKKMYFNLRKRGQFGFLEGNEITNIINKYKEKL